MSQGVLLHSWVPAARLAIDSAPNAKRPALPLLGLFDQQYHVRQPVPSAEKLHPYSSSRPAKAARASRTCERKVCERSASSRL